VNKNSMNSVVEKNTNRKLDVHEILTWLEGDGMVVADNAHMVRMLAGGKAFKDKHPLEIIAERHWIDEKTSRPLTLDVLTGWFARRVGLPYLRIDPLKVDVTQVTEVMSPFFVNGLFFSWAHFRIPNDLVRSINARLT